jgi:hypothetical protein
MAPRTGLTQQRLKELLRYEPETGSFYCVVDRRNGLKAGDRAGTECGRGWRQMMVDRRLYKAHRLAWLYMTGSFPAKQIDHINGNRADNRWCNLREADQFQNAANRKRPVNNTSGVPGVGFYKRNGKWGAHITALNKRRFLGLFDSKDAATLARQQAEIHYFGEYRRRAHG